MFRHKFTVYVYQRGLLYRYGKLVAVLEAGRHVRWGGGWDMRTVDMRRRDEVIASQEILTKDGLAVRLSASCSYAVANPELALHTVDNYVGSAYLVVQLALRDAITGMTADDLLGQRSQVAESVLAACQEKFAAIGLALSNVQIRDITFPGEIKKAFAQVVLAQKEAMASLERARGEMASLRSLANAAKMLENNPNLPQLRLIQSISEAKGATIVFGGDGKMLPAAP
jgi:regulator of protease activity HflC (stomatin/prohibitin superfamily)